jgi:PEP-CTERM motif
MNSLNHGRFQQQIRFLRRQFLQDSGLSFAKVLSSASIANVVESTGLNWREPIFSTFKNGAFPALNRNVGVELNFSLIIPSESHSNNNRAGFSAILLGSDQKGIELGFWTNEIWAQSSSPLFQHAEGVAIDTSISRNYRLQILNDAYTLVEGSNSLLSGNVRNYSSFGAPYSLSSFLFLGDDTSSGSADITLGAVSLQSDLSVVPEPSSILLLAGGIVVAMIRRRRLTVGRVPD